VDDLDGLDVSATQAALREDCAIVQAYGKAHPESWPSPRGTQWPLRVGFDNEPIVRVVAVCTGDLTDHEGELRRLVAHPGRLVLHSSPYSHADILAMRAEIEEHVAQRTAGTGRRVVSAIGEGLGVIRVWLRADQEDFAARLAERYGPAVDLQVGELGFPSRRRPHPLTRPRPLEDAHIDGLKLRPETDRAALEVGADGHGRLVFHNTSDGHIGPLNGGQPLVGVLLDASGQRVGGYTGAIAGTGWAVDLAPGEAVAVGFLFGTASFREEIGYVLPSGEYRLRVAFPFSYGRVGPPTHVVTAQPTQVVVTARVPDR
jgi:hypothetical protein